MTAPRQRLSDFKRALKRTLALTRQIGKLSGEIAEREWWLKERRQEAQCRTRHLST